MPPTRRIEGAGATGEPELPALPNAPEFARARAALASCLPGIALRRTGPQAAEPLGGACAELTGWEQADFAPGAVDFSTRIHLDDRLRLARVLGEAHASGEVYRVDYRFEARDGTLRWLRETGRCEAYRESDMCHAFVFDVTRERELEAQLLQSQKLDAAGRLATGVAHDFNNLLTVILGYADMLAHALREDSPQRAQAQQVLHAAQSAADLTRRLQLFTRRGTGEPRPFDLSDLLFTVDPLLRRLLGEDVDLVTVPGRDLGLVEADPAQLEQVLVHLAVNARQAMPEGGKLTLQTRERCDGEGATWVELVVRDTGTGMDAATRARLFEPFFTTRSEGAGLGLATARAIVEHARGRIEVETALGRGTTVTLSLPRSTAERPSSQLRDEGGAIGGGSETVLLVEDEALVRRVARDALARLGYEVLEARSGLEALELLARREGPVHLLLTDAVLPQMSGREVARRVLGQRPATRVLYMSGYAAPGAPASGTPGETSFLAKPFTPSGLAAAVRAALDA